jgi:Holliday junction DNA helicase RuvA
MIAYLTGSLFEKSPHSLVINNGGVGYEVLIPLSTFYALPEKDDKVSLYIHTHVREDTLTLFGFQTLLEKDIFMLLKSVSGIGPKLAVNILSGIGPDELIEAIAQGDALRLQAIPGVGKKTAQRIALELKEKAGNIKGYTGAAPTTISSVEGQIFMEDSISALTNLGYSAKSAKMAVQKAQAAVGKTDLERLIKEALRLLS